MRLIVLYVGMILSIFKLETVHPDQVHRLDQHRQHCQQVRKKTISQASPGGTVAAAMSDCSRSHQLAMFILINLLLLPKTQKAQENVIKSTNLHLMFSEGHQIDLIEHF